MKKEIKIALFGENGVIIDVSVNGKTLGIHLSDNMFRRKCLYNKEQPIIKKNLKSFSMFNIVEGVLRDMKFITSFTRENTNIAIIDGKTLEIIEE